MKNMAEERERKERESSHCYSEELKMEPSY